MALSKGHNVKSLVGTASGTAAGCAWAEVTTVFTWLGLLGGFAVAKACTVCIEAHVSTGSGWGWL